MPRALAAVAAAVVSAVAFSSPTLLGVTPAGQPALCPPPESHPDVAAVLDVEYRAPAAGDAAPGGLSHNTVDIYAPRASAAPDARPAPAAGRPVLVFVHGGGWKRGHTRASEWLGVYGNLGR